MNCKHPDKSHKLCGYGCKDANSCVRLNKETDTHLDNWFKNIKKQDIKIKWRGKDE